MACADSCASLLAGAVSRTELQGFLHHAALGFEDVEDFDGDEDLAGSFSRLLFTVTLSDMDRAVLPARRRREQSAAALEKRGREQAGRWRQESE